MSLFLPGAERNVPKRVCSAHGLCAQRITRPQTRCLSVVGSFPSAGSILPSSQGSMRATAARHGKRGKPRFACVLVFEARSQAKLHRDRSSSMEMDPKHHGGSGLKRRFNGQDENKKAWLFLGSYVYVYSPEMWLRVAQGVHLRAVSLTVTLCWLDSVGPASNPKALTLCRLN